MQGSKTLRGVSYFMFESSKEKMARHKNRRRRKKSLSPEVIAKLQSRGLDPETVTIDQLFPETLDQEGNDLSLARAMFLSGTRMSQMRLFSAGPTLPSTATASCT